jgi:hypothetical protein
MRLFNDSLLDQITVHHGPQELLVRFFTLVEARMRSLGLRLRLRTDFDRLIEVNEENRENWPPLTPIFDPRHSRLPIDSAYWIEAIDAEGRTVATHAGRLLQWDHTTLEDELSSLRIFYRDPSPHLAAGESVTVTAPSARRICGRTMAGGAVWVHPAYRQRRLASIVPRVSRAYALTRWDIATNWSLMEPKIHALGLAEASGPFRVEEGVMLRLAFRGELPALLMWMSREAMVADMAAAVDQTVRENALRSETLSNTMSPRSRQGMSSRS